MADWKCRLGFHDWVYVVENVKVAVGKKHLKRADYRICTKCELVRDL